MPRFSLENMRKYNQWIAVSLSCLIITLMLLLTFLTATPPHSGF